MKKIIAITLLLVMALGLCACGESNKEPRYVGTWQTIDETTTLYLREDGTAALKINNNGVTTYDLKWTADSVLNMTLSWDGTPVAPPETEVPEETVDEVVDTTEEIVVEDPVEETVPEETDAETVEVTEAETAAVDTTEAAADGTTTTVNKKRDPSIVGFGSLKVINGELWLLFSEGSSEDILLFTYGFKKIA